MHCVKDENTSCSFNLLSTLKFWFLLISIFETLINSFQIKVLHLCTYHRLSFLSGLCAFALRGIYICLYLFVFLSLMNKYSSRNTNAILKPNLQNKTKQNNVFSYNYWNSVSWIFKKSSFGISKHWYSFLNCGSVIKRIQLLLERHCRLKALQVHTWFCSWERVLSCESRMMQKMDETEFKEQ